MDDHLFIRILRIHLEEYNRQREQWKTVIASQGQQQAGGRLWFGGSHFADGTLEEFDEDCAFPCTDLSQQSPRPLEDQPYTSNFQDIDAISNELGIPWEHAKDIPFGSTTTYIGFVWNLTTSTVSLTPAKQQKYLLAV